MLFVYLLHSIFYYTVEISDLMYTDTAILTIQLADINDNAPKFEPSYTLSLDEHTPTDVVVYIGSISATDDDSGSNKEVRGSGLEEVRGTGLE